MTAAQLHLEAAPRIDLDWQFKSPGQRSEGFQWGHRSPFSIQSACDMSSP